MKFFGEVGCVIRLWRWSESHCGSRNYKK